MENLRKNILRSWEKNRDIGRESLFFWRKNFKRKILL